MGHRSRRQFDEVRKVAKKQGSVVGRELKSCLCCRQAIRRLPLDGVCADCRRIYGRALPRILKSKGIKVTAKCRLCSRDAVDGEYCDLHARIAVAGTPVIEQWVKPKRRSVRLNKKGKPTRPRCECGNTPSLKDGKCGLCRNGGRKCKCGLNKETGKDRYCVECRPRCRCGAKRDSHKEFCRACRGKRSKPRHKQNSRCRLPREAAVVYSARNEIIRSMGFSGYDNYLESGIWSQIRKRVFVNSLKRCCKCKGWADQVHHSEYTEGNLKGETLQGLHAVCGNCHHSAEFTSEGRKRSLAEANELLGITGSIPRQPVETNGNAHALAEAVPQT